MDLVLRAAVVYLLLLVILRTTGKRSMALVTMFDFILLLIISEAVSKALVGADSSLIGAAIVVTTLVLLERISDYVSWRLPRFKRLLESVPVVLVENGRPLKNVMGRERIPPMTSLAPRGRPKAWNPWTRSRGPCSKPPAASASSPPQRHRPPRVGLVRCGLGRLAEGVIDGTERDCGIGQNLYLWTGRVGVRVGSGVIPTPMPSPLSGKLGEHERDRGV